MSDGKENYELYYYLWHLIAIGALEVDTTSPPGAEDCPEITGSIWQGLPNERRKIALIDMGVARHHPNLGSPNGNQSQVDWDNALDLASHRFGAKYVDPPANGRHLEDRVGHLAGIDDGNGVVPALTADELDFVGKLKVGLGVNRYVRAYDERYASHGTSCAGLTSGRAYSAGVVPGVSSVAAYFGVDPRSQVIPITTSISPDPAQLIAAFLYAHSLNVDVILVPRDAGTLFLNEGLASERTIWPQSDRLDDDENTRLHRTPSENPLAALENIDVGWNALDKVIRWVSQDIPIVCAAGNEGRSELIYPASLASDPNSGVIAVGAVSYLGFRSGYSNYSEDLTIVAPSDDGEVYNRHQIRLDREAVSAADHWIEDPGPPPEFVHLGEETKTPIPIRDFAPQRLITLDVPGPRGYVEGTLEGPVMDREKATDDPGGLYTQFGGTSGASAIVAGAICLMQRKSSAKLSGTDVKTILLGLGAGSDAEKYGLGHWYWHAGSGELEADAMNSDTVPPRAHQFGIAGLLNLQRLLDATPP